jgi:hypothetical protein
MTALRVSASSAAVAAALLAGTMGCSDDTDAPAGTTTAIEPEYYDNVDVLQVLRRQALGLCFEPATAEDVIVDRTSGDGTVSGTVFRAGSSGEECIDGNYPADVCVVREDLPVTPLTPTEAAELEPLIAAMPHGVCEDDPNMHGDPCITSALYLDGTQESGCLGGTQLVEGHAQAMWALIGFIDALAVSKL